MSLTITDLGSHHADTYFSTGGYNPTASEFKVSKIIPSELNATLTYQGVVYTIWYKGLFDVSLVPANVTTLADIPSELTAKAQFSSYGIAGVFSVVFDPLVSFSQLNLYTDATSNTDYAKSLAGDDVYINSASATFDGGGASVYLYGGNDRLYQNHAIAKYNDVFVGGDGTDTLVLSSVSSNFKIQTSNFVWDEVSKKGNLTGFYVYEHAGKVNTTQLNQVEQIQFGDTTLQTKWFSEAQALGQSNPSQFTTLTGMYIAYFNRAPDAVGLDYWASNIYEGATVSQVARNFSASPEALATFGSVSASSSTTELTNFVNGVYQNVLNRASDVSGLVYWVSELKAGSVAPGDFILAIINAVNSQTGTADKTYVTSKTAVGAHFAVTDGLTNTTQAKAVMAAFNSTYATSGAAAAIKAANALSDSYLANVATTPELVVQLVGVNI